MERIFSAAEKKVLKKALASIAKHKDAIGRHRDALRDLMSDIEGIVDATDDGVQQIEYGIEALSQYL